MSRVLDNMDGVANSIFIIDVLTCIGWVSAEWKELYARCIENCFNHCFIEKDTSIHVDRTRVPEQKVDRMVRESTEHGVTYNMISHNSLMNAEGEDEISDA